MTICCIVGCSSRTGRDKGIRFFSIPAVISRQCEKTHTYSLQRRALWISRINRKDLQDDDIKKHTKVCSRHFICGNPSQLFDINNPDWAPSIELGYSVTHSKKLQNAANRFERAKQRSIKKRAQDCPKIQNTEGNSSSPTANTVDNDLMDYNEVSDNFPDMGEPLSDSEDKHEIDCSSLVTVKYECQPDAEISDFPDFGGFSSDSEVKHDNASPVSVKYEWPPDQPTHDAECQTDIPISNIKCQAVSSVSDVSCQTSFIAESVSCQTELSGQNIDELSSQLVAVYSDCNALREDVRTISNRVESLILTEDTFKNDDAKVKFYTGLPTFSLLQHVFQLVEKNVKHSDKNTLSKFQEFLIFLMRLRLDAPLQDLAYRFGLHRTTLGRNFDKWLTAMSTSLQHLLVWPDRETLRTTMPKTFQAQFKNSVVVIIDCFEVSIERQQSSLLPRAGALSHYKHQNTVKILIGITPRGTISFVSKAWVGHTSDESLTECSGLLDKLLPGDVILADRGFDTGDSVGFRCAIIPAITEGKPQLSFEEVESTQKIANLRIHVEKVIGLVCQKFKILRGTLPVDYMTCRQGDSTAVIDHIIRVCCALTNLCRPVTNQ